MSLQGTITEARTLLDLLQECERLIQGSTGGGTTPGITPTSMLDLRLAAWEAYVVVRRLIASLRRMGLPEDVQEALGGLQRIAMVMHTIYMLCTAIEMSKPFMAVTALLAAGTMLYDMFGYGQQEEAASYGGV